MQSRKVTETSEKIVEAYCRYIKGWATIPNIRCPVPHEIDLLSIDLRTREEQEIVKHGLKAEVDFTRTGCHGFCEKGPIVVIYPEEICYLQVTAEDIPEITSQTLKEKKVVDRLLYVDPTTGEKATLESDIPFY